MRTLCLSLFAAALLTAASCSPESEDRQRVERSVNDATYTDEYADEQDNTWDDFEDTTYQEQHGSSACTSDCSGHEAGYRWAEDHSITDPTLCGGNSSSFIEGCQAYANDSR